MINRNSFGGHCRVRLKESVVSDVVENKLASYYDSTNGMDPLLFDFGEADYIDIAALVNCIATVVQRTEQKRSTFFGYPKRKKVRDFLNVWRFDQALTDVSKIPFPELLLPEDHHYLGEKQTTYTGYGGGLNSLEYDADWKEGGQSKRNFFEFSTFTGKEGESILPEGQFLATARNESKRWASALIKAVLQKHLGSDKPMEDVARVIVYEAISNAVRHPKAKLIQCVSLFQRKERFIDALETPLVPADDAESESKVEGSFRICVWDDGDSIAETLLNAVKEKGSVRAFKLPPYMAERIYVQVRSFDEEKKKEVIVDQSEDPSVETAEARMLLSSLYPGVTRSLGTIIPKVDSFEETPKENEKAWLNWAPGMGLYALTRTVLDQFQGTLFIRSGNYRLIIDVAHDAYRKEHNVRYKCKITGYPRTYPPFKGNLLTIQLPIKQENR